LIQEAAAKKKEKEAMINPSVRSARELAEKQCTMEAVKLNTQRMKSSENTGRDP